MDAEVDQSIYKAFNNIIRSLQRELQIIHIVDQSEHGWAIVREMDSHQSVTDRLVAGTDAEQSQCQHEAQAQ